MGSWTIWASTLAITGAVLAAGPATAQATDTAAPRPPRHVYLIGTLRVTQPWIDTAGTTPGEAAAYLLVENRSAAPERLVGASIAGAASVALASSAAAGSAPDGALVVPGNGTLALKPGEAHLVLNGLPDGGLPKGPPVAGTIRFARAGALHLSFETDRVPAPDEDAAPPSSRRPVTLGQ